MATQLEKEKMKLQSAPGNSSVESRKGGAQQQEPVLKSANEQPAVQPILTDEQLSQSRAEFINNQQQAKEDYYASIGKKIIEQNNSRLVKENIDTPTPITAPKSYNEQMNYSEFDQAKGRENLKSDETFNNMLAKAEQQDKEYQQRAKNASRYAKIAAWGNLFTNLAKLAGGGKQTYVKHDAKYLADALAKSDKAREVYDAIREKNSNTLRKYEQDYMKNLEKIHYSLQAQENKDKADRNEMNQKMIQNSIKNAKNSAWLDYQIQNMINKENLSRDKFEYDKLNDRLNRIARMNEKEAERELRKLIEEMKIEARKDSKDNKDKDNKYLNMDKDSDKDKEKETTTETNGGKGKKIDAQDF